MILMTLSTKLTIYLDFDQDACNWVAWMYILSSVFVRYTITFWIHVENRSARKIKRAVSWFRSMLRSLHSTVSNVNKSNGLYNIRTFLFESLYAAQNAKSNATFVCFLFLCHNNSLLNYSRPEAKYIFSSQANCLRCFIYMRQFSKINIVNDIA